MHGLGEKRCQAAALALCFDFGPDVLGRSPGGQAAWNVVEGASLRSPLPECERARSGAGGASWSPPRTLRSPHQLGRASSAQIGTLRDGQPKRREDPRLSHSPRPRALSSDQPAHIPAATMAARATQASGFAGLPMKAIPSARMPRPSHPTRTLIQNASQTTSQSRRTSGTCSCSIETSMRGGRGRTRTKPLHSVRPAVPFGRGVLGQAPPSQNPV